MPLHFVNEKEYPMDYMQKYQMKQSGRVNRPMPDYGDARRQRKRRQDEQMNQPAGSRFRSLPGLIAGWVFQIVLVVTLAYVTVYFFGQTRTNVGQSMDTTLSGGDVVLLNILAYQMGGPSRGDIISFKPNGNESSRSSIKRVIGMPGETVQIVEGMIQINGTTYLEQKNFPVITNPGMASEPIQLGDTEYFVLGDNRNNSEDSRFADVGLVSSETIEGKVWFILNPGNRRGFVRS